MRNWLIGEQAKRIVYGFVYLFMFAYLIEIGIGLFGGAHEKIYHEVLPGYVKISTYGKYSGSHAEYVSPWVATVYHVTIGVMVGSFVMMVLLGVAMGIAKRGLEP